MPADRALLMSATALPLHGRCIMQRVWPFDL